MDLILASTSPYRRELLTRLQLPFRQESPDFDELTGNALPPEALVLHNTLGKARAVLSRNPDATVIASDQIALIGNDILGKPGTAELACKQLSMLSGRTVTFLTGVAVVDRNSEKSVIVPYQVQFRTLSSEEISYYIETEQPFDCAGSFKSEGLGISLFEKINGDDPTALIGLPLITLSNWLEPLRRGLKE